MHATYARGCPTSARPREPATLAPQMGVECNAKCKCVDCANGKPGAADERRELAPFQAAEASRLFDELTGAQDSQGGPGSSSASGPRDASMVEPFALLEMHTLMCSNEDQQQEAGGAVAAAR